MPGRIASFFRNLLRKRSVDEALNDELQSTVELLTREKMKEGLSHPEARREALIELGGVEQVKEEVRAIRLGSLLETFVQDLRFGLRTMGKSPGFTAVAILTLALGIGANTAIFSVINSVLLRNLPVKNPQQLVFLTNPDDQGGWFGFVDGKRNFLTYAEFQEIEHKNPVFSGLLAASSFTTSAPVQTETSAQTAELSTAEVKLASGSYFSLLGVDPVIGRVFTGEVDNVRDANPVAVISYGFWQDRFAGAPDVVGRRIRILNTLYTVIGVAPPEFHGETVGANPEIFVPLTMQRAILPGRDDLSLETDPLRKAEWLQVIGRLKPGVSLAEAQAAIKVEFQQMMEAQAAALSQSDRREFLTQYLPVAAGAHGASTLRADFGKPLQVLMAVVSLILLIACANVANILLARSGARQREISLRVALGAGAPRLFRQLLTESLLLAATGGAIGLLLAHWADATLLRMVSRGPDTVPLDLNPDARILAFTAGIAILTGILFGLAPAFRATRIDLNSVLKKTPQSVSGGSGRTRRVPIGKTLVVTQVAFSLLLLVVAGLFILSFRNLSQVRLGYDGDHLLQFAVNPGTYGYQRAEFIPLYTDILQRITAIPGVSVVSLTSDALLSHTYSESNIRIEGQKANADSDLEALWDFVGPNFFSATGIRIRAGRGIGPDDSGDGQRVGVVNEAFAQKYLPNSNPIGKRVFVSDSKPDGFEFVIVGVAADAKHSGVREKPFPRFYVPYFNHFSLAANDGPSRAVFIVRTLGAPSSVSSAVRGAVKQSASNLPPVTIGTMDQRLADSLATDRMTAELSGAFGALAIVLVCVGLYGIMAYAVSVRTHEIGIRIALGARRSSVLWLVLSQSLLLVLIGAAIGAPLVFAAGKWVSSLLFGVRPTDAATLLVPIVLVFVVGIFACCIPARRAMRVDPIVALRYE
jgi:predicted permease